MAREIVTIVVWIMNECDELNLDGKTRLSTQMYGTAQEMRASMTYAFGCIHGLGSMHWQRGRDRRMVGNPSVSEVVSRYMLSLHRRKVKAGEITTSVRAISAAMLPNLYHFNSRVPVRDLRHSPAKKSKADCNQWVGQNARRLLQLAFTLAFSCLLRVDEVLKIQCHDFIQLGGDKLQLTLPFRKTSQFRHIKPFVLHRLPDPMAHLCPTAEFFLEMFRNNLIDIGVDPAAYGTHLFRRGGCQWLASDLRWPLWWICEWGGWSTEFTHLISWNNDPLQSREDFFNLNRAPAVKCFAHNMYVTGGVNDGCLKVCGVDGARWSSVAATWAETEAGRRDSAVGQSGLEAAGEGNAMKGTRMGRDRWGRGRRGVAERHHELIVGGSDGRRVSIRVAEEVAMGSDYVDGERREEGGFRGEEAGKVLAVKRGPGQGTFTSPNPNPNPIRRPRHVTRTRSILMMSTVVCVRLGVRVTNAADKFGAHLVSFRPHLLVPISHLPTPPQQQQQQTEQKACSMHSSTCWKSLGELVFCWFRSLFLPLLLPCHLGWEHAPTRPIFAPSPAMFVSPLFPLPSWWSWSCLRRAWRCMVRGKVAGRLRACAPVRDGGVVVVVGGAHGVREMATETTHAHAALGVQSGVGAIKRSLSARSALRSPSSRGAPSAAVPCHLFGSLTGNPLSHPRSVTGVGKWASTCLLRRRNVFQL
ncbi:hypothetical protein EDB85DRAFT_2188783 [Lactarius pseudohatsudake]|nr:hypothetical protein EDB85DRAFT_2188783 [Lactarius pseudohatsudake]